MKYISQDKDSVNIYVSIYYVMLVIFYVIYYVLICIACCVIMLRYILRKRIKLNTGHIYSQLQIKIKYDKY